MLNPNNPIHLDRLQNAISWSRWRLQPFRENAFKFFQHLVGAHYSWSGAQQRTPINLIKMASDIYLRQLVARAPRAMVTAKQPEMKPLAADMQAWMDHASVQMRLDESLRICVMNAIASIGIMKVGEAWAGDLNIGGTLHPYGTPFADPITLDDWFHDMKAKRYEQAEYAGNRYVVNLEEAKANPLFDRDEAYKLAPQAKFAYNERGDLRMTTLSQSTMQYVDQYQETCELIDVWLPREKLVLTLPYQDSVTGGYGGSKPLRIVEWPSDAPQDGPYIPLSYGEVPVNVMPAAPGQMWIDLHEAGNVAWRKLLRQMERQKSILGVAGTAADDADRINRSNDGDTVRVDFPERAKEFSLGGMKSENILAAQQLLEQFNRQAGNLDLLGGLAPQSPTLGQDELLQKNSSTQMAELQDRTTEFVRRIYRSLAYWWMNNPVLTYTAQRNISGIDIPVSIPPQARQVPFESLHFDLDPYSMRHDTPESRLQTLTQFLQTILLPLMPMAQQQGGSIDVNGLVQIYSRYGNMPDLADIYKVGPPPQMQGPMQVAGQALQPSMQVRKNIRESRPTMTSQGHNQVMQQLLAGSSLQPSQRGAA